MSNKLIRRMTINALFVALIIIFTFVPYLGYIGTPAISICTIHVIVIVGAMLFGWKEGLIFGFTFGLFSLIRAATMPVGVADPAFINPLVSVLPRVIFGGLSGLIFDLIKKIKEPRLLCALISVNTIFSTIIHTAVTLSCFFLFGYQMVPNGSVIIGTILSINGALEIGMAFFIPTVLMIPLFNILKNVIDNPFMDYKMYYKFNTNSRYLRKYRKDMIKTLGDLVGINSVFDSTSADKNNPFGKGVSDALNYIHQLAKNDGFESTNYDNKIVEILCGDGDKNVTIMAHADVVPVTGHTKRDMFKMYRKNFTLYGRGVSDDKGPFVAAYYALKALRDNDLIKGFKVRFLVGGNEESGSLGMKYYFEELKKEQPTYGFSPDSDFPLTHAEKGIFNFVVTGHLKLDDVISITGGVASNAVIDECVLKTSNKIFAEQLISVIPNSVIETIDDLYCVKAFGIAAHGSMPDKGKNAAIELLNGICKISENEQLNGLLEVISPTDASGYKADAYSPSMGKNTINLGFIQYENEEIRLVNNFRFVDGVNESDMKNNIVSSLEGYSVEFTPTSELLYYPVDHILVKTLMEVYQTETGDYTSKPMAIGGGTYAKEAENVLAFGMQFPRVDTKMHESGEFLPVVALYKGANIYFSAILKLGQLIKNEN